MVGEEWGGGKECSLFRIPIGILFEVTFLFKDDWVKVLKPWIYMCHYLWTFNKTFFFYLTVLRHDRDELLHGPVWGVTSIGRAGTAHLEPSPRLPSREAQVYEHGWSDEVCGLCVRVKLRLGGS